MRITARVHNRHGRHDVMVATDAHARPVGIPAKEGAPGSAVNGGELLFLALATCYCNDVYREAKRLGVPVDGVEVEVRGEFGGIGEPARDVTYRATVTSSAPEGEVRELLAHTDRVAEIQNTLRRGVPVVLEEVLVRSAPAAT
jgi:uncharacterized OsmC-like protein